MWPSGTPDPPPDPPSFHVWITRKVAPHMAVVDLRCDAVPWACFRRGPARQHQFGIHSGNFIQFVFPATDDYPAGCGFFSFALYITKVALKGRVVLENPDQVGDPIARHRSLNSWASFCRSFCATPSRSVGVRVWRLSHRPSTSFVFLSDRLNTTVETCVLPPISLSLSFLVPVSAFPGLFQHLAGVPFYRLPKTLGWPYSDAPLNGALIPDPPLAPLNLAPLLSLLRVLPFFTPPSVRNKVTNYLQGDSGCHYTLDAIVHILEKGMRPGTKKPDGDIETTYDWPLNWEIPDFTSDLCKGLSTFHPDIFRLLTSLGRRFIAKFLIALLAADGHFITLLLSTLWGLRGGFTTLCLQGIFGSGKTYCASMMLVVATSILGIPTLLTAEPNLPLYTAADTICDLLRDASDPTRAQYARLLAQNIPVSTPIDYGQEDRANLFQENSPLRCVLITQGGLLRQLCHSYSHLSTFIKKVCLAFNDESQQGGKAGFTVIGANLPCSCLQCLTGDQERPVLAVKNSRKLWLTNWRIRPSGSWEAPNHTSPPPCFSPCSRLFVPLRSPTFLLIETLHSTSSNTSATLACPSPACPLLSGKPKEWCPLPVSPYTSSFHILSDVLQTLTSPRWPCIILISNTPRDRPWPLVIMKTHSLTKWRPNSP